MKKKLLWIGLAVVAFAANAKQLPVGGYNGCLSGTTSNLAWGDIQVTGDVDNGSKITIKIPDSLYLNSPGVLTATIEIDDSYLGWNPNMCKSVDANIAIGSYNSKVTFENCNWNGIDLTAQFHSEQIQGVIISGTATMHYWGYKFCVPPEGLRGFNSDTR